MKIALFHNTPTGGARRVIYEHCKLLGAAGHKIHLFKIGEYEDRLLPIGTVVRGTTAYRFHRVEDLKFRLPLLSGHIDNISRFINYCRVWGICRKIAADINRGNFDLAYVHHCAETQTPPLLRYLKIPSVFFCQEPYRIAYEPTASFQSGRLKRVARLRDLYYSPIEIVYRRVKKRNAARSVKAATLVLANSFYSKETVYRCYGVRARLCPLGVDGSKFTPRDVRKENAVVTIGRLQSFKGHDFIIDSLALIPPERRPKLIIIADTELGGEREYLTRLAAGKGVRLEIEKLVPEDEMADLICRARVFVYAAVLEPFGLAVLEAMACGLPVVGVGEAGIRETVEDGLTGILTERDSEEFARAVEKLLSDSALSAGMSLRARERIEGKWTWNKSVEKLLREFERARCLGGGI